MKSGYFDKKQREFVITDMQPRRPLLNYIWNEEFLMGLDHTGQGISFAKVVYDTRRTVIEAGEGSRLIYIKDRKNGKYFCANKPFSKEPHDFYETHVGVGVQTVIGEKYGIRTTFSITAPIKKGFAELWKVTVENVSERERSISLYAQGLLAENVTPHNSYNDCNWSERVGGLYFSHESYLPPHDYHGLYFSSNYPVSSFCTSLVAFKGHYRTYLEPLGVEAESLDNKGSSYDEFPTAALEIRLDLKKGESKTVYFVAGTAKNETDAAEYSKKFLKEGLFEEILSQRLKKSLDDEAMFTLNSGNDYLDNMVNIWLKNQIDLGKTWARVYGKGFRDIMQDVAAFASFDPDAAKEKIHMCLSHQFADGNTIRMFEPFLRHPYRDGAAWIPETISVYLNETGDTAFLEEECPYFESKEKGTILDHMRRGIKFLTTRLGEHGLCLWGGGDWNDSINAAGMKGLGESVWLSIATVKAIKIFAEILSNIGEMSEANDWLLKADKMTESIYEYGWDTDHFIYGFNDWGEKIGSYETKEGQIYLNAQTWAILSGIAAGEKGEKLMQVVEEKLHCSYGYVQCAPSYTKGDAHIGRSSYFMPGCVENGSVYNHGVTFKIAADCVLGRAEDAYRSICEILPTNPELADCGVEPYAMTNMYLGPENPYSPKFAPCSWITGTAGWMYRCITEYLLGVKADFNGLKLEPCIPKELDGVKFTRRYRGAVYNITVHRGNGRLICDGEKIQGNTVPVFPSGTEHTVEVYCQ